MRVCGVRVSRKARETFPFVSLFHSLDSQFRLKWLSWFSSSVLFEFQFLHVWSLLVGAEGDARLDRSVALHRSLAPLIDHRRRSGSVTRMIVAKSKKQMSERE